MSDVLSEVPSVIVHRNLLRDIATVMPHVLSEVLPSHRDHTVTSAIFAGMSYARNEAPLSPAILLGVNLQDAEIVRFAASISRTGKMTFDDCLHFVNTRSLFHRFYERSATRDNARVVILNRRPPSALYVSRIDQPVPVDARKNFESASLERQLQCMVQLAQRAEKIWAQPIATGETLTLETQMRDLFDLPNPQ